MPYLIAFSDFAFHRTPLFISLSLCFFVFLFFNSNILFQLRLYKYYYYCVLNIQLMFTLLFSATFLFFSLLLLMHAPISIGYFTF